MSNQDLNNRVFDLLNSTGLNWTVSKEPLISSVDNAKTAAYGIFKKKDRTFLSAVGNRYEPYQNSSLAEAMILASEGLGKTITRGGQLNGGGKVYLQAELPKAFIGKSDVKRWLTGLNSHDGSSCIGFGSSNTVVVCQNTFYMAYRELQKVRHTMSAKEIVKAMAIEMNTAMLKDEKLMNMFKHFATVSLQEDLIEKVIRKIFNVDGTEKQSDLSTRKLNQVKAFHQSLKTEIELEGPTVWGLFNGITRYTNHVAAPQADEAKKTDYLMTGGGYELSNKTFDLLVKELGMEREMLVTV